MIWQSRQKSFIFLILVFMSSETYSKEYYASVCKKKGLFYLVINFSLSNFHLLWVWFIVSLEVNSSVVYFCFVIFFILSLNFIYWSLSSKLPRELPLPLMRECLWHHGIWSAFVIFDFLENEYLLKRKCLCVYWSAYKY